MNSPSMSALAAVSKDVYVTWEMKQLARTARNLGYEWIVLDPRYTSVNVTDGTVITRRFKTIRPRAVLGRVDVDDTIHGPRLLRLLNAFAYPVMNGARCFTVGRDKAQAAHAFNKCLVPHPKTWLLSQRPSKTFARSLPFPLVVKPVVGSEGRGVRLVTSPAALMRTNIGHFPVIAQQYCGPVRRDIRVLIVQDRVIGSVQRIPKPGEWRGNARLGASVTSYPLDDAGQRIAIKAAQAVGARFCAVDLVETDSGYYVIEVNVCPGFRFFAQATGIDVARAVVSSLVNF